jgi:hypothetical protein
MYATDAGNYARARDIIAVHLPGGLTANLEKLRVFVE